MMKWDVKHDKAKMVIDAFLEGALNWQKTGEFTVPKRADLQGGLEDEDRDAITEEVGLMIASIRKRYKLQERLPEQPKVEPELVPMPGAEKLAELKEEVEAEKAEEPARPKRTRKKAENTGEKKERKPRAKKEKEEEKDA